MKKNIALLSATLFLMCVSFSAASVAGTFNTHCFGSIDDCSSKIADLITDKFIATFPSDKWTIVIVNDFHVFSDGGGAGFSVVGVVPRQKITSVPKKRFNRITTIGGRNINAYEATKYNVEILRLAVQDMMAACDQTKNCTIYMP
jgi:hypothetical protein